MRTKRTLSTVAQVAHAINVDRDDPFLARRLSQGTGGGVDYSRTRRIAAPIEERFTLIRKAP